MRRAKASLPVSSGRRRLRRPAWPWLEVVSERMTHLARFFELMRRTVKALRRGWWRPGAPLLRPRPDPLPPDVQREMLRNIRRRLIQLGVIPDPPRVKSPDE
jgi:hypothetical protein